MEHRILVRALAAMLRHAYNLAREDDPLRAMLDQWIKELDEVGRSGGWVQ